MVEPYLQAFSILNASRHYQVGMESVSVMPIALTEILSYLQIIGITDNSEQYQYLLVIQALDEIYLKHARETINRKTKK